MPIFYHNRPRTARISCGSGAGRSLLFVKVQAHPVVQQPEGVVQRFVSGEVGAKGLPHDVGQGIVGPVDLGGAVDELLENPDMLIAALTELKAEREHRVMLEHTVAVQNQQITEMKPKASYYDVVLNCKDLVAISTIAKDYGWSANRMNRYLYEKGVQFKQGNKIWLLYQKYAEKGYTSTKTHSYPGNDGTIHTKIHTYWTQQGRLFIYGLLKENGILPIMEREVIGED